MESQHVCCSPLNICHYCTTTTATGCCQAGRNGGSTLTSEVKVKCVICVTILVLVFMQAPRTTRPTSPALSLAEENPPMPCLYFCPLGKTLQTLPLKTHNNTFTLNEKLDKQHSTLACFNTLTCVELIWLRPVHGLSGGVHAGGYGKKVKRKKKKTGSSCEKKKSGSNFVTTEHHPPDVLCWPNQKQANPHSSLVYLFNTVYLVVITTNN